MFLHIFKLFARSAQDSLIFPCLVWLFRPTGCLCWLDAVVSYHSSVRYEQIEWIKHEARCIKGRSAHTPCAHLLMRGMRQGMRQAYVCARCAPSIFSNGNERITRERSARPLNGTDHGTYHGTRLMVCAGYAPNDNIANFHGKFSF